MGTLRIHGIIDIKQFWPIGSSDADTTKFKLIIEEDSFEYKDDGEEDFSPTVVFKDAISKGQGSKPVINTSKRDGTKTITIRLQGIDAPELHYKAAPLKSSSGATTEDRAKFNFINEERRQHFAESSTFALAKHLEKFTDDDGFVTAVFESEVDHPFEVVDTYGRFIGDIFIGEEHDINVWVIENGWALPTFYTSMSEIEIQIFLDAWKKGKTKKGRTSKAITYDAGNFDWDLLYRRPPVEDPFKIGDDKGKSLIPKIFRRQTSWMVSKKSGVISKSTSFHAYLKKSPDQMILLNDFLRDGIHSATVSFLHDFVSSDNIISKKPEEFVFKEKPGTLVNAKGVKITKW